MIFNNLFGLFYYFKYLKKYKKKYIFKFLFKLITKLKNIYHLFELFIGVSNIFAAVFTIGGTASLIFINIFK